MPTDVELMIREAVLGADPSADESKIALAIAGVSRDPAWRDLLWLSREQASGTLATGLAKRAIEIAAAISAASVSPAATPGKPIHERFDMSAEEFRKLPPQKKRELSEEAAKHDENQTQAKEEVATLQAKLAAGTITPTEKLTLGHLTAPTKAEKRTPNWQQAQDAIASLPSLRSLIRGHEQVYGATSSYPQSLRDHHEAEANRLRAIVREREAAGEV